MIANSKAMTSARRSPRRVRRAAVKAGSVAVAVGLLVAGCGSSSHSATNSSGSGKGPKGGGVTVDGVAWPVYTGKASLHVWTFGGEPQTQLSISAFEKAYPNIKVSKSDVGGGTQEYAKLATVIKAGSGGPDVALLEYDNLPQFVASKGLVDISPYVGKYMSLVPKWVASEVTFNKGVYEFPAGGGTMGMFYNPKLLAKYSLPVPTTYATFASDATKLHKADPSVYMTYFPVNDGSYTDALWMQAGANPFSVAANGDWTIDLTSPTIEKVTSYWVNLVRSGAIQLVSDFTPAWEHDITSAEYATYMGASWEPGYAVEPYVKTGTQTFVVKDMPQWSSGTPIDANWGGSGYAVTKQSKYPQAAALFSAFMDLGTVKQSMEDGGSFPLVNNVATYAEFKSGGKVKDFTQPNLNVVFNNLQKYVSPTFQFSPWTSSLSADLEVQLQAAMTGKESAAQALSKTQAELVSFAQSEGYTVSSK